MTDYTVYVAHNDGDDSMLDCNFCGPIGLFPRNGVSQVIYDHLKEHGCNMDTVSIHQIDPEEQQ